MSKLRNEQYWLMTGSLMILAVYATGAILIQTQSILIPFVLAILFVSLIAPLVDLLVGRFRFPHSIAVTVAVLGFMLVAGLFGTMLISAMRTVAATVEKYGDNFSTLFRRGFHLAANMGVAVDPKSFQQDVTKWFTDLVTSNLMLPVDLLTRAVLVLIFVVFLLLGRVPVTRRGGIYAELDRQIRHYVSVKVILSALAGLLVWIVLEALGMELAGVFGLLTFLLNFIPVIGAVIATLLPLPMAIADYQNPWWVVAVIAVPGLIEQIIGNGIEPKWLGKGLSLHPVTVVMSLAIWGLLWGGAGMLLAVPITGILRIVLLKFESVRPIGRLLGGELPKFGGGEGAGIY